MLATLPAWLTHSPQLKWVNKFGNLNSIKLYYNDPVMLSRLIAVYRTETLTTGLFVLSIPGMTIPDEPITQVWSHFNHWLTKETQKHICPAQISETLDLYQRLFALSTRSTDMYCTTPTTWGAWTSMCLNECNTSHLFHDTSVWAQWSIFMQTTTNVRFKTLIPGVGN